MSTADDLISFSFFFLNSQLAKQTDFFKNIYLSPKCSKSRGIYS